MINLAEFVIEIVQLLKDIYDTFETVDEMFNLITDMDLDAINDITANPSQEFSKALQAAIDLKLKGVTFDEIEKISRIKIGIMNEETEFGIGGTGDLMLSMEGVADAGQRLVDEVLELTKARIFFDPPNCYRWPNLPMLCLDWPSEMTSIWVLKPTSSWRFLRLKASSHHWKIWRPRRRNMKKT